MPTDGLEQVVIYNLLGTAGTDKEVNMAQLRGVNHFAPTLQQEVIFGRMSGSKTQDVQVTLPDGTVTQAMGMVKTERFAGLTSFMSLESATYSAVDYNGNALCGAKIRLQFNRNFVQYLDPNQRDWDSLWYYDVPCSKDGPKFSLKIERAKLRALVMNEVWQARIASGSFFFNWGHSVTAVGGPAARLSGGWWLNWDKPSTKNDAMGAAEIANGMVLDLESSRVPWVEFSKDGDYANARLIYSAGDADQYLTWNRALLDRQNEYVVLYRPYSESPWDFITVKPIYNYEWNDVLQNLTALRGWGANPLSGKLNDAGMPEDVNDAVVKEIERVGWMNSPNSSLEQIQFIDSNGKILYAMTVRAFIGASDTLVMFGRAKPPTLATAIALAPEGENLPRPILYDEKGKPLAESNQEFTPEQWARWQRESTFWNFLKDNPGAVGADLMVQYRFVDNTDWAPVHCTDSDGDRYVCGYRPVEWNLSTSYYFDGGNVKEPWLVMNLLGEVGVRTLGMSYASGLYQGTGMLFAMAQVVHQDEFFTGYEQESLWTFDARAAQLPDRLAEAWSVLHEQK